MRGLSKDELLKRLEFLKAMVLLMETEKDIKKMRKYLKELNDLVQDHKLEI
jgi:hypothetical protein